jgi:hypothetical protein
MVASSPAPAKRHPGRPLGSKNKKHTTATADPADCLDVSLAQPSAPSLSSGVDFPSSPSLVPNAASRSIFL